MAKKDTNTASGGPHPWRRLAHMMTPRLFAACFITAMLNMLFGFDTSSFAGVQSIPGFERQFGSELADGSYRLSSARVSFISSIGFAGKFCGTLVSDRTLRYALYSNESQKLISVLSAKTAPFYIEKIGHRLTIFALLVITAAGVVVECTAYTVAQFVVGRIIVYYRFVPYP